MIGVDTNVLLRYVLDDDPIWSPIATRFIDEDLTVDNPGHVASITLVEMVWSLRRYPGYDRKTVAELIDGLLASEKLVLGEASAVARALASFREGGAGFADYLIAEMNRDAGADTTVTIDRKAASPEPFSPLS